MNQPHNDFWQKERALNLWRTLFTNHGVSCPEDNEGMEHMLLSIDGLEPFVEALTIAQKQAHETGLMQGRSEAELAYVNSSLETLRGLSAVRQHSLAGEVAHV